MDQVIKEGLNEEGVALLHTEEVPGNAQRLFAVVGNGIKVTYTSIIYNVQYLHLIRYSTYLLTKDTLGPI